MKGYECRPLQRRERGPRSGGALQLLDRGEQRHLQRGGRQGDGRRLPDRLREARRRGEVPLGEEQHGCGQHDQGEGGREPNCVTKGIFYRVVPLVG